MGKKLQYKRKIPSFIRKLVQILQDDKFTGSISWLAEGSGFQIDDIRKFNEEILPCYFKHRNLSSFIRQLNMYGFIRPRGSNQYVYYHSHFQKGNTNAMRFIKRKNIAGGNMDKNNISNQSQSQSEFIVRGPKNQVELMCNNLLMQNQQLKKQNEELLQNLHRIEKQLKDDKKVFSQKNESNSSQTGSYNKKVNCEPFEVENGYNNVQINPYFGIFPNNYGFYLMHYHQYLLQNLAYSIKTTDYKQA